MERADISLLAIAGGSCSGKDSLINELEKVSPEPFARLSFDDYFVGMRRLRGQTITDWERPELYRYDDFVADLKALRDGQTIEVECHSRESMAAGITSRIITPTSWTLVYGWLVLHADAADEQFDRKVFLDISEEEMIRRRIARTTGTAGWDGMDYIKNMLVPGHRRYVLPQRERLGVVKMDGTRETRQLAQEVLALMK